MSSEARVRRRQRGVTMIELIMFIVIVSVALASIMAVMRLTTANSADPLRRKQALMIAEGLLEEVRSAGFTRCDPSDPVFDDPANPPCTIPENWGQAAPEPLNPRPFDNVNDYVAQANVATNAFNNVAGVLVDVSGQPIAVNGYTATLTVTPVQIAANGLSAAAGSAANTDALRIRVSVAFGGDAPVVLDTYRTRYARPGFQ
ncbi:type II secretion system protein [Massilia sp. YIM B02769]|uniref:type II secretion system protein n=1 Tax=Massilia sp. YIM B02769 TaxID=3050129 RepID=UPI0025B715F6|nr:type II secretion system protein [Massilia sp. YIM B02769]MDN4060872.1 type II secretion system protein [Massilia sp. YIM B02769]